MAPVDTETAERMARLETLLEGITRSIERQGEAQAHNREALKKLETRQAALEETHRRLDERSAEAKRIAGGSIVELRDISAGLIKHLQAVEENRLAEVECEARRRDVVEETRRTAAAAHATRFDEQGRAIAALVQIVTAQQKQSSHVEAMTLQASRVRLWSLVLIPLIAVLMSEAVDLWKFNVTHGHGRTSPAEIAQ